MRGRHNVAKWSAIAAGTAVAAAAAYVALNSRDCEAPDISRFDNRQERPADADNVYCGIFDVTNAISEATGLPVLDSVFGRRGLASAVSGAEWSAEQTADDGGLDAILAGRRDFWLRYVNPAKAQTIAGEEKDAVLADAAKALAILREAARRKTWYAFDPSTGERCGFPPITLAMNLAQIAGLDADRRLERGETGAAIERVRDIVNLANKMEDGAESVLTWLVSAGIFGRSDAIAMKIVKSGKATDEELAALQAALRSFDLKSRPERMRRMMNNELFVVFAQMTAADRFFTQDVAWLDDDCVMGMARNPLLRRYAFHRNRTLATYAVVMDRLKELYAQGYDKAAWDRFGEELDAKVGNAGWCFGPNFVGRKAFSEMMPAWRSISEAAGRRDFFHSAAETVVAAERFRRKTGAYPKSLSELVPEYLPSVPEDPFKKGATINYDAGRGVMWTVGADGDFDGKPCAAARNGSWGMYGKKNRLCVANIDGTPVE